MLAYCVTRPSKNQNGCFLANGLTKETEIEQNFTFKPKRRIFYKQALLEQIYTTNMPPPNGAVMNEPQFLRS